MLQNPVSIESNMRAMHEQSYAAVPEHRHGFMRAPPSREGRMLQNSVSEACVGFSDFVVFAKARLSIFTSVPQPLDCCGTILHRSCVHEQQEPLTTLHDGRDPTPPGPGLRTLPGLFLFTSLRVRLLVSGPQSFTRQDSPTPEELVLPPSFDHVEIRNG